MVKYGEKTVAYVSYISYTLVCVADGHSFGSLFFPPTAPQIPILIESLAKRGKPSLIVAGNCTPEINAILGRATEEKGQGLVRMVKWVAQQEVLEHPVTSCPSQLFVG